MTGRRAVLGLCMLCALLVSAFAAQSASAVTKGTTAFTCKTQVGGKFLGEHCLTEAQGGSGSASEHVAFAANTTTSITGTNAKTAEKTTAAEPSILKATIAGVPLELTATGLSGSGTLENKTVEPEKGEHYVTGEGTITYTNVIVAKPEGKGCNVFTDSAGVEGEKELVHTNLLKATTQGQGDFVKFEPKEGNVFATFFVTCTPGKVPAELEGTYEVTGSVKCPISGATIKCNHTEVTAQNTLKTKGVKAGINGALTITGKDPKIVPEEGYTPITATTIETP